jgi:phosphomevalonate kinase
MFSVKAPGKLYIAGEYAVVESGIPAIIVAINEYITATIGLEKEYNFGKITSGQYKNYVVTWKRESNQDVYTTNNCAKFNYVMSAMKITDKYALQSGKRPIFYNLSFKSDLNSSNGKKYGLGSSAAVSVATVKAVAKIYELKLSKMEIFKLASIAHFSIQGNGSLGDVAASSFGGWIAYSSFDKEWFIKHKDDISYLMIHDWPKLMIKSIQLPNDLKLLIGWTGKPASTSHLLKDVKHNVTKQQYAHFLNYSKKCINHIIQGFNTSDLSLIKSGINSNRKLLQTLATFANINIETDKLKLLCDIANKYGGFSKSSGAGGGDCGIVLISKHGQLQQLEAEWKSNGIVPLHLQIHYD